MRLRTRPPLLIYLLTYLLAMTSSFPLLDPHSRQQTREHWITCRRHWPLEGELTVHRDKRIHERWRISFFRKFICRISFLDPPIQTWLQLQDELKRTLPLSPVCKEMIVDLVGWSPGAQNVEK